MSIIQVKFDHQLQQSDIVIPLTYSSQDEAEEIYVNNQTEQQQTAIYGIQAPLIMVNNIVVNFSDVISFELSSTHITPEVSMVIQDRYQLITALDTPSIDNELRIQILPKFDDKYKKINLTFYITQMRNNDGIIHISGEYKSPKFISSNIKSFGEKSIYQLAEAIAQDSQLGFATNVEDDSIVRYRYCDNKSYKELLNNEVSMSCNDTQIYDFWIDWWNNLVLADIYERYNAVDSDEDMTIWSAAQNQEVTEGSEIEAMKIIASLHNHPSQKTTELYVVDYKNCTSPGAQMYQGTDRVFSIYELNKSEYMDYLIQDGDSKKDIFYKYEYLGEVYGDHNYLLGLKKYETFKQKISSNETVEVTLRTPLLGIMRGNHVNFFWYVNDSQVSNVQNTMKSYGVSPENPETNIPTDGDSNIEDIRDDGKFEMDKSVSGQYLVTGCTMKFKEGQWQYVITLSRPTINKPKLINEE
jgi:hypothetical protein